MCCITGFGVKPVHYREIQITTFNYADSVGMLLSSKSVSAERITRIIMFEQNIKVVGNQNFE